MMRGKTSLTVENEDCLEEALAEAFPTAKILKNEIAQIRSRPRCDYVIRRGRGNYDIGLRATKAGTYEIVGYNPGVGDRHRIDSVMSPLYTSYIKGVVKKAIRKNPQLANMTMKGDVKTAEVEMNGKKIT